MDFEFRINGYTEEETRSLAYQLAIKLGFYKARLLNAIKQRDSNRIIMYNKFVDVCGNYAHVNLLRSELFNFHSKKRLYES